jgi:hypothetical protein
MGGSDDLRIDPYTVQRITQGLRSANAIAAKLGPAAGIIWEEDQYVQGTLKIGERGTGGN